MQKKALAVAIAAAMVAPAAMAIDFSVSGQVNRMVRMADDGVGSDVNFVDNGASNSRVRFTGSEDIGNGMMAGVNIEMAMASNAGSAVSLKTGDGPDNFATVRHSALFFSGNWGKVTMGHTSDAADGRAFADLSNTWLVNEVSSAELGSAIAWRSSAGGSVAGLTLGATTSDFDGNRQDVLRYDTPALGPVSAAVSIHQNSGWAVGAGASTALGGGELSAAVGYEDFGGVSAPGTGAPAVEDRFVASLSYLFSQGTSLTFAYGEDDRSAVGRNDADMFYAKLGHQWGSHAVSIHYGEYDELALNNSEVTMYGVGWVYTMRNDIELYAGYNNWDADVPPGLGVNVEDIDIAVVGSRVKF